MKNMNNINPYVLDINEIFVKKESKKYNIFDIISDMNIINSITFIFLSYLFSVKQYKNRYRLLPELIDKINKTDFNTEI
jgi:hypothetical protein